MPEKNTPAEHDWSVILDDGQTIPVRAAYIQYGGVPHAGLTGTLIVPADAPVVFKDADHKVVLLVRATQIRYVRRERPAAALAHLVRQA